MFKKYRRLLSYIGPYKNKRIYIVILCTVSIIIGSAMPFLIGKLISLVEAGAEVTDIVKFGAVLAAVGILAAFFNSWQNYEWHKFATSYTNYFRVLMLKAAFNKDIAFYKDNDEDFTSRILNDSTMISSDISIGFPMLILNVLRLLIVIVLMAIMSLKLTLIIMLVVPVYVLVFHKIDGEIRGNSKKERTKFSVLNAKVKEYLRGIFQIKINNKEEYFCDEFQREIDEYEVFANNIKKNRAIGYGVSSMVTSLLPILILILGSIEIKFGRMELGYLFSFYTYLGFLYEPMKNLSDWYTGLQVTLGMSDRVLDFLDTDCIVEDEMNLDTINSINIEDLKFSYDGSRDVLYDINIELASGDILGIVGSSGSGKSTLIDILLKTREDYRGSVKFNDKELKGISKESIYKNTSVLEQNPFVFQGTIRENIEFNENDSVKLNQVIKDSGAYKLIENKGLDYGIMIDGENLSGGEKQRIGLARALYKNSNLLILDEFTSALDNETEMEIVENINELAKLGMIIIIITHRKAPLKICNKILNLDR